MKSEVISLAVALALYLATPLNASSQTQWFSDRHGRLIHADIDKRTGSVRQIYGFQENISDYGLTKATLDQPAVEKMFGKVLDDYSFITKIAFKDVKVRTYQPANGHPRIRYFQAVQGIPVEGSYVALNVDNNGDMSMSTHIFPDVHVATSPSLSADTALALAKIDFGHRLDSSKGFEPQPQLAILPEQKDSTFDYHLVWRMTLNSADSGDVLTYFVSALDGKILKRVREMMDR